MNVVFIGEYLIGVLFTGAARTIIGGRMKLGAVARALIGRGVNIHIFVFCPTNFFLNQVNFEFAKNLKDKFELQNNKAK